MSTFVIVGSKRAESKVGIILVFLGTKNSFQLPLAAEISPREEAKQFQKKWYIFTIFHPGPGWGQVGGEIQKNHEKIRENHKKQFLGILFIDDLCTISAPSGS